MMALVYLTTSGRRSRQILREFRPDVVMGTGGYVSGPLVRQAAKMGIPTLTHEQNAFPGVTTKLLKQICRLCDAGGAGGEEISQPKRQLCCNRKPGEGSFFYG